MFDDSEAYTVAEVAPKLKCSEDTIYRMIKKGLLGCVRLRRSIRICGWQINEYLRSNGNPA